MARRTSMAKAIAATSRRAALRAAIEQAAELKIVLDALVTDIAFPGAHVLDAASSAASRVVIELASIEDGAAVWD